MFNLKKNEFLNIFSYIPGILFLFVIGLISKYIGSFIPYISHLLIAIGLGLLISNFSSIPEILEKGVVETHKIWLMTGIVILGSNILFVDLLDVGPILLVMILFFLLFALILVEQVSSKMALDAKLGSCLASGTSVCGVSAIIATGGGIMAKEKHMAMAIATVLIFDVITVFSYPILGEIFSIPSRVFGPWAGISMFSTGTAVAAGFAHSDAAGQLATVAKMARNVFIGVWSLSYTLYYVNKGYDAETVISKPKYLWEKFPKFVLGFLATMIIANLGLLNEHQIESLQNAYNWLFMLAFVGLGYNIDIRELKNAGLKPIIVVLISFIIISILCLFISYLAFS